MMTLCRSTILICLASLVRNATVNLAASRPLDAIIWRSDATKSFASERDMDAFLLINLRVHTLPIHWRSTGIVRRERVRWQFVSSGALDQLAAGADLKALAVPGDVFSEKSQRPYDGLKQILEGRK